ncbi:MAG: hypothetical protein RMI90_14245, partial [Thermoguttaceae bacterium]|nr:hypothetical protein [Thermoguttaceae bacterium]
CVPAGGDHPILKGVREVYLEDLRNKSFTLAYPGVIPLLAGRDVGDFRSYKEGDTLWSLVRYGKGWISDPKPIQLNEGDGSVFWTNFVKFCLGEIAWEPPGNGKEGKTPPPPQAGPLTGMWQESTGAQIFFEDDGKEVNVKLVEPTRTLQVLTGTLKRADGKPDAKNLEGTLTVTLKVYPRPQRVTVRAVLKDENTMDWICPDWPIVIGTRVFPRQEKFLLTRVGGR